MSSSIKENQSPYLFPKTGISFVSHSVIEAITFSCEKQGKIFALETPGDKTPQLMDVIFTYAVGKPAPPWYHIKDLGSEASEISKKDFYFRAFKVSKCGSGFKVLSLAKTEMLFFNSLYQMLGSCFFSQEKLPPTNALSIKNGEKAPWMISYEGGCHLLQSGKKKPQYVLELSTAPNNFYDKLIFSKLLHSSVYERWIEHIPEERERLKGILLFISKNQEAISEKLLKENKIIVNISSDPANRVFILMKKIDHKLEAFFVKGDRAYGLTNFSDYQIQHITDETGFDRLCKAYQDRRAYCRIFQPEFDFRFTKDSKYVAFKINDWGPLSDAVIAGAAKSFSLRGRDIDHVVMTWVKTLTSLHQGGCELNSCDFSAMFCKAAPETMELKIMLTESIPYTDGADTTKSFAFLLYQLWLRYKLLQDISCFSKSIKLTPEFEEAIIRECQALIKSGSIDDYTIKKLTFIQKLFNRSMTLVQFSREFELIYNEFYFGMKTPKDLHIEDIK